MLVRCLTLPIIGHRIGLCFIYSLIGVLNRVCISLANHIGLGLVGLHVVFFQDLELLLRAHCCVVLRLLQEHVCLILVESRLQRYEFPDRSVDLGEAW